MTDERFVKISCVKWNTGHFFFVCGKTLRLRKKLNRTIESHCIWTSSRSNHSRNCRLESASLLHVVSPENSPPHREYLVNIGNSGISFYFFHLTHAILSRVMFVWNKKYFRCTVLLLLLLEFTSFSLKYKSLKPQSFSIHWYVFIFVLQKTKRNQSSRIDAQLRRVNWLLITWLCLSKPEWLFCFFV